MILNNPNNPSNGFIQQVQLAYKKNNRWPASGSADFINYVSIANRLKDEWAMDADHFWNSLFRFDTIATIPTSNPGQAYPLATDVFSLSDWVQILRTDGNTDIFIVVHPNARNQYNPQVSSPEYGFTSKQMQAGCFLTGNAGNLQVNFVTPLSQMTGDLGGQIQAGVYYIPPDMVLDTDIVTVDDPTWLVYATAEELARNDPAKQDQAPTLAAKKDVRWKKMVAYNQGNSYQQPNGPAYQQQNIGITWPQF